MAKIRDTIYINKKRISKVAYNHESGQFVIGMKSGREYCLIGTAAINALAQAQNEEKPIIRIKKNELK